MRAQEVIDHIFNLPEYKALGEQNAATRAVKLFLGKGKESLVRYAYKRAQCLYIATHNAYGAQELNHDNIKNSIKNFLNVYFKGQESEIKIIKVFVPKNKFIPPPEPKKQEMSKEQARGNFDIKCSRDDFVELFVKLQRILRQKELE